MDELMMMIAELRRLHEEREDSTVCLAHWRKVIFLLSIILRSSSLPSLNNAIVGREAWISAAVKQENNKFFHEKTIRNYVGMITERLINIFDDFLKKIRQTDMNAFETNDY